jgi:isopentenyl phosphate kinase
MTQKLYGLKMGGSVITDKTKPYVAQKETIRKIAKALKSVTVPLIVSHGVGSFAHTSAKKYGGKNGYVNREGIAKVARDAQEINRIVMDILVDEDLPVISFSPRSFIIAENGILKEAFFAPIEEALKQGLIPVIYGDGIWDIGQKTTIFSGETTLNLLCQHFQNKEYQVEKIVQLCNVDGVLDENKEVIPEITKENWPVVKGHMKKLTVTDVTGGMQHKVEDALRMSQFGIETVITNGNDSFVLQKLFTKTLEKGTVIR